MELRDEIAELVRHAGGIFNGIWDTPRGRFATLTDPSTLSTALTPVAGISIAPPWLKGSSLIVMGPRKPYKTSRTSRSSLSSHSESISGGPFAASP